MTEEEKNISAQEPQTEKPEKREKETKQQKAAKETQHHAELAAAKTKASDYEKQLADVRNTLLRTAAEYDNFRKRSAKEHDAAFQNGVGFAVTQLLPVLDTLTLAANAETTDENYKKGVVLTLGKCQEAFTAMGVAEIDALDKPFDPAFHAAVLQQPCPEGKESGTVLQVLQTGYLLGDRVIRHATVAVAE
ncbi:MAG: nucleotide exchange factor GrpE [Ruthenibacterium sp.]